MNPLLFVDAYKLSHRQQYPVNTSMVYSNMTARSAKIAQAAGLVSDEYDNTVVNFGLQGFIKEVLVDEFNREFFSRPKKEVIDYYRSVVSHVMNDNTYDTAHIEALHKLGHLPLRIASIAEGLRVPIGVPLFTFYNTDNQFFWLTNYLETLISQETWKPITIATIAREFRLIIDAFYEKQFSDKEDSSFIEWMGHCFSARGMSGRYDDCRSNSAHLLFFNGTDSISSVDYLHRYYNLKLGECCIGGSVPATEHSVMCSYGKENEQTLISHLINNVHPTGIVSIVSDTWDFWKTIGVYAKKLKSEILNRNGKVVFRPDSGDPVKIICGDPDSEDEFERKGAVQVLWDIFGGTTTSKGFKVLNEHVGLIYGDSITLERAKKIMEGLHEKGFAISNIVFGIGSFTYQYLTRDTFGMAVKSTYVNVGGYPREIYKDPVTDKSKTKKSAKGLITAHFDSNGRIYMKDQQSIDAALRHTMDIDDINLYRTILHNGIVYDRDNDFESIRKNVFTY